MENVSHIQYTNRNVSHCDFFGEYSNNICLQSTYCTQDTNMASDCPVNDDEWFHYCHLQAWRQVVQNVQQHQLQTHVSLNSLYMHTFDTATKRSLH